MSNKPETLENQGLNKGLKFIYVYAIATGAIFTFIGYWDSIFYSYCGPATGLAFLICSLCVLPIAMVYGWMSPLFPSCGGELIYNTVGFNKHVGFLSSWLVMGAWIAVPPAAVMAIIAWISRVFHMDLSFQVTTIVAVAVLILYCIFSLLDIALAGKVQLGMLVCASLFCIGTGIAIIVSGNWHIENLKGFFSTELATTWGVPGWLVGFGLLLNPFFGFETVPQMIEEGNFPIKDASKAIWGSVATCGVIYAFFFFCIAGVAPWDELRALSPEGFLAIAAMEQLLGWHVWPIIFGIGAVLCAIGTCLLGFWVSTVRLLYAMGEKNFLPKSFTKVNKHHQPILPNLFLLGVCILLIILQNATTFMTDFYNLMSFSVACCYGITMLSALRMRKQHPEWVSPTKLPGGDKLIILSFCIAVVVAFFCMCGQGIGSWKCWGIFMLIGVVLWLYMVVFRWRKSGVVIETPTGDKEY